MRLYLVLVAGEVVERRMRMFFHFLRFRVEHINHSVTDNCHSIIDVSHTAAIDVSGWS